MVQTLQDELSESRNFIAALKIENEELKVFNYSFSSLFLIENFIKCDLERKKKHFDEELSRSMNKNEEYKQEIKQWEVMYKEWMQMMEDRVTNINRTHQILQVNGSIYFCFCV